MQEIKNLAKALPSFCHFLSPPAKAGGNSVFVFHLPTALQEDCVGIFLGICNSKTISSTSYRKIPPPTVAGSILGLKEKIRK
jgi:hypothetical protein